MNRPNPFSKAIEADRKIYRHMIRKRAGLTAALLALTTILVLVNMSLGSTDISLSKIITILFTGKEDGHTPMIVLDIRLPMALMALAVGACLGLGGCEIQTILRNPIASPYTLGITHAASFGAALGLILDANVLNVSEAVMVTSNAFFFALLASVLVYAFSLRSGSSKTSIILFGIALNFMFAALTMVLQYVADDEDLQSLVFWNMGSMLKTTWVKFWLVFIVLILCSVVLYKNAWKLTAMSLDDTKARSLGVNTHKIRRMVILLTSLLTAFATCFVGSIGFVGIIAPHIARYLVGEDQRFLLPLSGLVGALVVSFAFVVSKVVIPGVILPIGLVTAIIGIPIFLSIIFNKMRIM
jgi:iron complex transport system permease protein